MLELTDAEAKFVLSNECCRLATSFKDKPHVVPVSYIYENNLFYIATDYKTKKLINIIHNPNVCIVIDIYQPKHNQGFVIFGNARLIEKGDLFKRIYSVFFKRFEWVRNEPWSEGEAPFVEIYPTSKVGWGINPK